LGTTIAANPVKRAHLRLAIAMLPLVTSGCSWFWPNMVRTDPADPELFRSGFPLVGAARTDGAVCSLATAGPDATVLVSPPEPLDAAAPLDEWCATAEPARPGQRGRIGRLVTVDGKLGRVHGYLYAVGSARGLLVAFSGLGMPAAGWMNERFAELAARRGFATFAPVRDESARPIAFDPLREARRALGGALHIRQRCRVGGSLAFVGVSMGGMEALLANREARAEKLATRVAVLDPLLDPPAVTEHLDSFWHSFATDAMQAYFRRILRGRYGEPASTSFREVLNRTPPNGETVLERDAPRAWLCQADPRDYAVFVSDSDPVLGERQSDFARKCGFPLRPAKVKGHVGVACRLELFDEMVDAIEPAAPRKAGEQAIRATTLSTRTRGSGRTGSG
jgi:hypothetical protein